MSRNNAQNGIGLFLEPLRCGVTKSAICAPPFAILYAEKGARAKPFSNKYKGCKKEHDAKKRVNTQRCQNKKKGRCEPRANFPAAARAF